LTFDDLSGQNKQFASEYRPGCALWGPNAWWLSGPFGQLRTKSVSLHPYKQPVRTQSRVSFVRASRLMSLVAYNGGNSPTTVHISCDDLWTPPVNQVVAAGEKVTIATGWTGYCLNMTLGSTNGANTNYDDLVIEQAPLSGSVVTFEKSGQNQKLVGQYPAAFIDWGDAQSGSWYHSGPTAGFPTKSVSFREGKTSASFTFVGGPRKLINLQMTSSSPSTVTLQCVGVPANPDVVVSLTSAEYKSVATNWTIACPVVDVMTTNGWSTNFDNLVVE
jgi:hypothetical protein